MGIKFIFFHIFILFFLNACFVEFIKRETQENLLESEKQWHIYRVVFQNGKEFQPSWKDTQTTMSFDVNENRIFGINICNNYFASFTLKGRTLKVSGQGSSRRICFPDESVEYGYYFLKSLYGEFMIYRDGEKMRLEGKEATYYLELLKEE